MKKEDFQVGGITCQACVIRIEKKLKKIQDIEEVVVNPITNVLSVNYNEDTIKSDLIIDTVKNLGYEISLKEENEKAYLDLENMTCQSCVIRIEKKISKLQGVKEVSVNLTNNTGKIEFDKGEIRLSEIIENIEKLGYGAKVHEEKVRELEKDKSKVELIKLVVALIFGTMILYIGMGHMYPKIISLPMFLHNPIAMVKTQFILSIPIVFVGRGFFIRGSKALFALSPSMDTLITLGTGAAFLYSLFASYKVISGDNLYINHLYYESGDVVIALVMLGKYFEEKSKKKTSEAIKKLGELKPQKANLLRNNEIIEVLIDELLKYDEILIKPGEIVAADGLVIKGTSFVDESMITGESIPVEKKVGEKVIGGTINKNGSLTVKVEAIGKESTLSKIIKLVEEAQSSKAPIARLADKISAYFVPIVLLIATVSSFCWYYAGVKGLVSINEEPYIFSLTIFITVLVIACPCALGLATPTAIMVGTGKGAAEGILIKGGAPLEMTYKLDTIVFDKTGTLTEGKPIVTDIFSQNMEERELLYLVASAESHSEHPLGEAIVKHAKDSGIELANTEEFKSYTGLGIQAIVDGQEVTIGNEKYLSEKGIKDIDQKRANLLSEKGKTPLLVAINNEFSGIIAVADTIKKDSKEAVKKLKNMGINVVMLTGDNRKTAAAIAKELDIEKVIAEVLPSEKSELIKELKNQGKTVGMVGDGINDAPSLALADVGIAIGNGTDIAIESADIVLMKNSILDVSKAIRLSKKTITNIKQNLFWAFAYNIIGIPVAAGVLYIFGGPLLSPQLAGAAMALSSISVVTNALRLKKIVLD